MNSQMKYNQEVPSGTTASLILLRSKLYLDLDGGMIIDAHKEILLTAREVNVLRILVYVMNSSRAYIKASALAQQIISAESADPEHSIEQTISTIRRKLGEVPHHARILRGRRGIGYRLFPEAMPHETHPH